MQKLFGTDGVRGTANNWPIIPDVIMKLASHTIGYFLKKNLYSKRDHPFTVVIGKDTRLSGYMVEPSLVAGFVSMGAHVVLLGPLPTPAVAMLVTSLRADLGVMISASHNPYYYNGIKFFNSEGFKLSNEEEEAIEKSILENNLTVVSPENVGRVKRLDDAVGRYIEFIKRTFPKGQRLDGLKIVVDCANGAAYKVAPLIFWELGAEVIPLHASPNGLNINEGCGAIYPKALQDAVLSYKADIGLAFDGDADRLVIIDETGAIIDGDQLIALIVKSWQEKGYLKGNGIVGTSMSNLGLERYLAERNLILYRTSVGDRSVTEGMKKYNSNIGGEPSGHIILKDYNTTGDALVAALQVLSIIKGEKVSKIGNVFTPVPQILKNIRLSKKNDCLVKPEITSAIMNAKRQIEPNGSLIVRPSGTEPLIRIMAQGDNVTLLRGVVDQLARSIEEAAFFLE